MAQYERQHDANVAKVERELAGAQAEGGADVVALRARATLPQRMALFRELDALDRNGVALIASDLSWHAAFRRAPEFIGAMTTPSERYRHVLFLLARRAVNEALHPYEDRWLGHYLTSGEYETTAGLVADFGEAALR